MDTYEKKALYITALYGGLTAKQSKELYGMFSNAEDLWRNLRKRHAACELLGDKKYKVLCDNMTDSVYADSVKRLEREGITILSPHFNFEAKAFEAERNASTFDKTNETNRSTSTFDKTNGAERNANGLGNTYEAERNEEAIGGSVVWDYYDSPSVLFARGDTRLLETKMVAVCGTRKATGYGKRVAEVFTAAFVQSGISVLTGVSLGIEAVAVDVATKLGGNCIGILPCGFYALSDDRCARRIVDNGGLLLSEYAPDVGVMSYHYLERNRLLAMLADVVLIVEAGNKSGALSVAEFAAEYGKNVYAVPGELFSVASKGTNKLIKEMCGVALEPADVIRDFVDVYKPVEEVKNDYNFSEEEYKIIDALKADTTTVNGIVETTGIDAAKIVRILGLLEIGGIVFKSEDGYRLAVEL
ncbi:MAG: DNA-processing protein DprA [Clostridia bacterium]|nr:DNA-processing protein DprA [Clostridia bacterium]